MSEPDVSPNVAERIMDLVGAITANVHCQLATAGQAGAALHVAAATALAIADYHDDDRLRRLIMQRLEEMIGHAPVEVGSRLALVIDMLAGPAPARPH